MTQKQINKVNEIIKEMKKNANSLSDEFLIEEWENELFLIQNEHDLIQEELKEVFILIGEEL